MVELNTKPSIFAVHIRDKRLDCESNIFTLIGCPDHWSVLEVVCVPYGAASSSVASFPGSLWGQGYSISAADVNNIAI